MNTDQKTKEITGDITPLPWFAVEYAGFINIQNDEYYSDKNNVLDAEDVGEIIMNNNGSYIVKACNLFPELIEALEAIIKISDRNHDAWNKAKELIQKAKQ